MNETAARELRRRLGLIGVRAQVSRQGSRYAVTMDKRGYHWIYVSQVGVTALGEMVRQAWEKNSLRAMMRQARLDDLEKRRAHAMVE